TCALPIWIVEVIARVLAPALPLPIEVERDVLAHAQQAPCEVALPPGEQRAEDVPHREDLDAFEGRHPAVPAGAGSERGHRSHPLVLRQEAEGVTTERVAHDVQ